MNRIRHDYNYRLAASNLDAFLGIEVVTVLQNSCTTNAIRFGIFAGIREFSLKPYNKKSTDPLRTDRTEPPSKICGSNEKG